MGMTCAMYRASPPEIERLIEDPTQLDEFITGTGFAVMPVVGVVADSEFVATPDPREVAGVFEVPLGVILDRTAMGVGYFERHGSRLLTYELHYGGRRIWGATAAVLRNFQDVILDDAEK